MIFIAHVSGIVYGTGDTLVSKAKNLLSWSLKRLSLFDNQEDRSIEFDGFGE